TNRCEITSVWSASSDAWCSAQQANQGTPAARSEGPPRPRPASVTLLRPVEQDRDQSFIEP
ncbi:MAG: hypothetical protein ACREX8_06995, partial [Gammaproteobacteria bacterium]